MVDKSFEMEMSRQFGWLMRAKAKATRSETKRSTSAYDLLLIGWRTLNTSNIYMEQSVDSETFPIIQQ